MALDLKQYQKESIEALVAFLEASLALGPAQAFGKVVQKGLTSIYRPMPGLPDTPYVCLRIPTGGGKTIMGAHIIHAASEFMSNPLPMVLWLVPTTTIKSQTLEAFKDKRHPYRQALDERFSGQVEVFDITEFNRIRPADVGTKVCVLLSTVAALRVEETEGRKVYQDHEDLEPHFAGGVGELPNLDRNDKGKVVHSFANLCRLHRPLVLMDEAHNANTPLSYEVYTRLTPAAVVELTATPDLASSNVLVSVSAFALRDAKMIKLPVVLEEHKSNWQEAVSAAVARRKSLVPEAMQEAEYIRPILLIQAENKKGEATVEEVKKHLIDVDKVDGKTIAIATGDQRELDGINLFDKDCHIEVIITKQALKEGWDCSFAYVFCSVAQVKSSKDIQQLLGRVLRMPYAAARRTEDCAMSKAYAHVVSPDFASAAGELTQALIDMGFNPVEAAAAIRKEAKGARLPLTGGAMNPPVLPVAQIPVSKEPDLVNAPARDQDRITFIPNPEGKGGVVEIHDEVDEATVQAIVAATPKAEQEQTQRKITTHQHQVAAAKAPSERGAVFQVPRFYVQEQGELDLVDKGAVPDGFTWDLLAMPIDLSSFQFNDATQTFEVSLDGEQVIFRLVKNDVATYLPGFAQDRTEADLVGWLDTEVRDTKLRQPVIREWIRRAVDGLQKQRGFSLAQLLKGQFVLRRKFREELLHAKATAYKVGFQQFLFDNTDIVVPAEPDHAFTYPPDMLRYPARDYFTGAWKFEKHYYPRVGDLRWKTSAGDLTEEFQCAMAIDSLDEVDFWVRNLVDPSQFWMPTATDRTYPDFVLKLKDGRLLVVEYKGAQLKSGDDSDEKRLIGELWEKKSGGKGLYLMLTIGPSGVEGMREALLAKINK